MNENFSNLLSSFSDAAFENVVKANSYIPLLVTYTKQDAEINGLRKAKSDDNMDREPEYFSALEALGRSKCIILSGASGMGKSTFLKVLTLCMKGELAHDPLYNLTNICQKVARNNSGSVVDEQFWVAGALAPYWLDISQFINDNKGVSSLPADIDKAQLLLIDGIESISQSDWSWVSAEINDLHTRRPELFIVAACEADAIDRLRPRLSGFTSYTVNSLIDSQKSALLSGMYPNESAEKISTMVAQTPAKLRVTLANTQSYLSWIHMGQKPQTTSSFFEEELAQCKKSSDFKYDDPARTAFNYFTETLGEAEKQSIIVSFADDKNLLRYLACNYCLENDFGGRFGKLISETGNQSWSIIGMLKLIISEKDAKGYVDQIFDLCPAGRPEKSNCLQALFTADLLFEIRDSIGKEVEPRLYDLQKWISAIVTDGWLTIYDRVLAGKYLSWLGDDRDLEAMISVPAGVFTMGDYLLPNNQPVTDIAVEAFKMGLYPVVNKTYRQFIEATGRNWISEDKDNCARQNCPAVSLTWYDAVAFCDWLTEKWRAEGKITKTELVRLPTEAEWEYAARGKYTSQAGIAQYPWGTDWKDDHCNTQELGLNDTCAVGLFPENVSCFGLRDMNGMVWEWNSTLWGDNPKAPAYPYPYNHEDGRENSRTAPDEIRRCMRGGSFGSTGDHATCCYRGGLEPIGFWRGDGFRIVVSEVNYDKSK